MNRLPQSVLVVLALALLVTGRLAAQDPNRESTFGAVTLKAGFEPDPFRKKLVAGGPIQTKLGGVKARVAQAPDFRLNYTSGKYALTIKVKAAGGATLLVNLPDGTWAASNDGGRGIQPRLSFANPQSGRYDIFVGTIGNDNLPATLLITEREGGGSAPPPPPPPTLDKNPAPPIVGPVPLVDCYLLAAGVDNYRNANKLKGCLNDARNTLAAFTAQKGIRYRKVETDILLDATATRQGILSKFQALGQRGSAGDFMVLFLSGHGGRTNGNRTWFFLPFDFHPKNEAATTLTDKQLLDAADGIVQQKKNVLLIIDACFSGQLAATAQPYLNRYTTPQAGGLVLMLSSSATQTSAALGDFSAFAKAFADSMTPRGDLNRDGKITLAEIKSFSYQRTAQFLAQAHISDRQDSLVTWSPSLPGETVLAIASKTAIASTDPVTPLTGKATRYVGSENLAGYGKLAFLLYPGNRAMMVDARDTVEGTWQQTGNQFTITFLHGSVVYRGTLNGATLSGTASGPGARQQGRHTWNWSVSAQGK